MEANTNKSTATPAEITQRQIIKMIIFLTQTKSNPEHSFRTKTSFQNLIEGGKVVIFC